MAGSLGSQLDNVLSDCYIFSSHSFLQKNVDEILHTYYRTTRCDRTWYRPRALTNFELIRHMEGQSENKTHDIPGDGLATRLVQALEGMCSGY
jgi:hypothetical protein